MNGETITKEDIREAEGKLLQAQLTGNTDTLNQLLYDDLVALSPAGQVMTKEMDIDSYRTGTVVLEQAVADISDIRITGDTAVAIVSLQARGTVAGNVLEGQFRYLRVWKRFDDGLKIMAAGFIQLS